MKTLLQTVVMWAILCGFVCAQSPAASVQPQQQRPEPETLASKDGSVWASQCRFTPHFVYLFSSKDQPVQALLDAQEAHYRFCAMVLGCEMPSRVYYLKYPDPEAWRAAGNQGGGFYVGTENCIHSRHWFQPHEAVHAYLSSGNRFLSEGIADAFGTTFYWGWGDVGEPEPHTKDALLQQFFREKGIGLGGNFARWVFYRFGAKKLVQLAEEASGRKQTRKAVEHIFSKSLPDLASQWEHDQEWLKQQKAPDGFFVRPPWKAESRAPMTRRNPFGMPDVFNMDGAETQALLAPASLPGDERDENAALWCGRKAIGSSVSIEGRWMGRWNGGTADDWEVDEAEVKVDGNRVWIRFGKDYLIESRRTGADAVWLAGRYVSASHSDDTSPWVGRIVGNDRIDGRWESGRFDFRRAPGNAKTISPAPSLPKAPVGKR